MAKYGMMQGIAGIGQGAMAAMQMDRQHRREDERDAMLREDHDMRRQQFGLNMDHTRQQMRQGEELHPLRTQQFGLHLDQTRQQMGQSADLHPLQVKRAELGVAEQRMNLDRAAHEKFARQVALSYQNAAQFFAAGRFNDFVSVFNRFLPEENQIVGMQQQGDGNFLLQYGGSEDDTEVVSRDEIGRRLRAMGNPQAWMEEQFAPQDPRKMYGDAFDHPELGWVQPGPDGRLHQFDPKKMPGGQDDGSDLKDSDRRAQYRLALERLVPGNDAAMLTIIREYQQRYGEDEGLARWAQEYARFPSYPNWVADNYGVDVHTGRRIPGWQSPLRGSAPYPNGTVLEDDQGQYYIVRDGRPVPLNGTAR